MSKPFWNKKIDVTAKSLLLGLIVIFALGVMANLVFLNFVFPQLATAPGFRVFFPGFPIIVNRTEEIRINEGIKAGEVHDQLKKNIVTILRYRGEFDPRESGFAGADLSNGIVATSDGIILATKYGVGNPNLDKLFAITDSGDFFEARVLLFDSISDLVILESDADNLSAANFGNSKELLIGDKLLALFPSLSRGNGPAEVVDFKKNAKAIEEYPNYYSSDSVNEYLGIFPELSTDDTSAVIGDRDSRVVGFHTPQGILTGEFLLTAIDKFLADGELKRVELGVNYISSSPLISSFLELPRIYGALVVSAPGRPAVTFGSAAAKSGLRENDFIYKINEREITEQNSLERLIYDLVSGDEIEIHFYRNSKQLSIIFQLD